LLAACGKLLTDSPLFVLLNVYTTVVTQRQTDNEAERLRSLLMHMLAKFSMALTIGKLALEDSAARRIFVSVFAQAVSESRVAL
jgi:hypothetical protein